MSMTKTGIDPQQHDTRKRKVADPDVPAGHKRCRRCGQPFKKSRTDSTVNCPGCRR